MDLIRLVALERRIGETLGRRVEILPEPVENPRLRGNVERDRALRSKHDPAHSPRHLIEKTRVERYLFGMDRKEFEQNDWARDAIERCIDRVCEAVVRLGEQADELMPAQPWGDIRGMGNRLRHAYDRIDVDVVWRTAKARLLELAAEARPAPARLEGDTAKR